MVFVARTFIPHVSIHEGRGLEQLLAEHDTPPLGGAVVEATFAATDPPLIPRLRGLRIPYTLDPQTIRFSSPRYLTIESLATLPYAPRSPVGQHVANAVVEEMIRGALDFQALNEVDVYLTPTIPMLKPTLPAVKAHRRVHELAAEHVGSEIARKPLLASVAPTLSVMRSPYAVYEALQDRAYDGIYVQPVRLNPKLDSVEWLTSYADFLLTAHAYHLPVVAARAGAFGLVLCALGVDVFDAGLGERESFNLSALNRPPRPDPEPRERGGPRRRTYAREILTSIDTPRMRVVLESRTLGSRFSCDLGRCRFSGYEEQMTHHRDHFFHVRRAELDELRRLPTTAMRVQHIRARLQKGIETGKLVNGCLEDAGAKPVSFAHLEVWMGVLARVATRVATEAAR